ncbi:NHL repeat-containing protein [Cohnella rhizosphaerae]|uniref:WD40 repeat domain-containing protein n=1 Tax=Cohnella rhizosphaerae TaxID=1457232 RepID=A0A9X4L4C5_9BACL|nr:hypothetical protein [Cohnella rhizosphaerae]MDG0813549.1 hypothetical protein [Cohnella rhizosphaerae]
MQYDPATHTLVNLGKVSDNPKNLYSRPVWGEAPGFIFVYYGFDTKGLKVYDIAKGTFQEFGRPEAEIREINDRFICTQTEGQLDFYDPRTLQPLDDAGLADQLKPSKITLANGQQLPFIELEDGRLASFRGQDYFIVDKPSNPQDYDTPQPIALAQIPAKAPVTEIFTLVEDPKGRIWGASGFGQTIFRFDPATGEYWNSSSVCNEGGEVYGMVFVGDRLFTASYVGGDHTVYDPDQPWDQLNNVNPRTLRSVGPRLIRPEGRSVRGPDGGIWTGWSANYGVYGGGLSRVDTETLEVENWYDPIPERAIASVAADDQYVYFTTHSGTSGLSTRHDIPWQLGIWEPGKGLIDQYDYPASPNDTYGIAASQGKVAFAAGVEIHIFDVAERKVVHTVAVSQPCLWLLKLDDEHVAAFCGDELIRIHLHSGGSVLTVSAAGNDSSGYTDGRRRHLLLRYDFVVRHQGPGLERAELTLAGKDEAIVHIKTPSGLVTGRRFVSIAAMPLARRCPLFRGACRGLRIAAVVAGTLRIALAQRQRDAERVSGLEAEGVALREIFAVPPGVNDGDVADA